MRKVMLGDRQEKVLDDLVRSGRFASEAEALNELIQAGAEALRENDASFSPAMRGEVQARLNRNEPRIPAEQVFAELRAHLANREKAKKRGA